MNLDLSPRHLKSKIATPFNDEDNKDKVIS